MNYQFVDLILKAIVSALTFVLKYSSNSEFKFERKLSTPALVVSVIGEKNKKANALKYLIKMPHNGSYWIEKKLI